MFAQTWDFFIYPAIVSAIDVVILFDILLFDNLLEAGARYSVLKSEV